MTPFADHAYTFFAHIGGLAGVLVIIGAALGFFVPMELKR